MRSLCFLAVSLLALVPVPAFCHRNLRRDRDIVVQENKLGASLPIIVSARDSSRTKHRRTGTRQSAVGLGDYLDVVYNVLITVGGTRLSVILDTGSSDLWVTSDACSTGCGKSAKYMQSTFNSTGQGVELLYGDSSSGTYASGLIGSDTASVAGLSLPQQYLAAINNTNTSISETGSSGIFGLGFPMNSLIFKQVLMHLTNHKRSSSNSIPTSNLNALVFPDLTGITNQNPQQNALPTVDDILSSFSIVGPLMSRLIATGSLSKPLIAITLQRDTIEIGGNVGILNIGQLPAAVEAESLTWVPLRMYTVDQGGLTAPADSPHEVYPITWEVFLDDVYLDGRRLPPSQLSMPDIQLSALIDTGNSIIRGPLDVLDYITSILGNEFPCNEPHELSFSIGGKMFPVDPRDLIMQVYEDNVSICTAKLLSTTTPTIGRFLYSWSLGTPFLKGVLSAYYYGNLTYPSHDPPRMGFLSTVPHDAGERLIADVNNAADNGQNFPSRIQLAPTGMPTDGSLNPEGVATVTGTSITSPTQNSGAIQRDDRHCGIVVGMIMTLVLTLSS
ncbi:hypothetical protein APHAL10511_007968 [Amanita phalloides]|nr:hypothetical protein APHAL10511_007968 [Amanita phalloides]